MTSICVWIENTISNYKAIQEIMQRFPCFYSEEMKGKGILEVNFKCRQEDAAAVERLLAKLV